MVHASDSVRRLIQCEFELCAYLLQVLVQWKLSLFRPNVLSFIQGFIQSSSSVLPFSAHIYLSRPTPSGRVESIQYMGGYWTYLTNQCRSSLKSNRKRPPLLKNKWALQIKMVTTLPCTLRMWIRKAKEQYGYFECPFWFSHLNISLVLFASLHGYKSGKSFIYYGYTYST